MTVSDRTLINDGPVRSVGLSEPGLASSQLASSDHPADSPPGGGQDDPAVTVEDPGHNKLERLLHRPITGESDRPGIRARAAHMSQVPSPGPLNRAQSPEAPGHTEVVRNTLKGGALIGHSIPFTQSNVFAESVPGYAAHSS
eukprot:767709-Hanusia_phi.AAC.3